MECPTNEILLENFGEYSLSSKAYRMQGGKDLLFREVARVLLEYGFVHPRPPAIPKYRAGFVIAAYEGLKVDWLYFITEGLKDAIIDLVEGKKPWAGIAQWLTVLVPPVLSIIPKKIGLQETTPKKATKHRQLLRSIPQDGPRRTKNIRTKGHQAENRNWRGKARRNRARRLADQKNRRKKVQ